jgi:hypothetical protein
LKIEKWASVEYRHTLAPAYCGERRVANAVRKGVPERFGFFTKKKGTVPFFN